MKSNIWIYLTFFFTVSCTKSMGETNVDFVYHNYTELTRILKNFNESYPEITHLYSIGKTVDERELWVIAISGNSPQFHESGIPEVKYVGNMHGDEVIGREVLIHFIGELLSEYTANNEEVKEFLDRTRVHILPTMNPDGFERAYVNSYGKCTTTSDKLSGRYNSNSFNLNRNFPDYFEENLDEEQPETQAIVSWLESTPFLLSANLHGGALVANYPWDNLAPEQKEQDPSQYSRCPDDDIFRNISFVYSYSHENMYDREVNKCGGDTYENDEGAGFEDGVTNGAEWYWLKGGMQDYNYFKAGCLEITLEISCCKFPLEDQLEAYYNDNRIALLQYLKTVHQGIRGIVRDENSSPVEDAYVEIVDRESNFFRTFENGEYWRILLPGEYEVQVSKECYESSIKTVTVPDRGLYNTVEVNFILTAITCTSCRLIPSILIFLCLIFVCYIHF